MTGDATPTGSRTRTTMLWVVFVAASAIAISKLLRADTDFGIYLDAARDIQAGGVDIFRPHDDHGPYPYPHWVVMPLVPLLWLPETLLRIAYGLLQGLATVWIVGDVHRLVGKHYRIKPWHWVAFGLLFARWFSANYTNGQLSLWVAAFLFRGCVALDAGDIRRGGVLLGVAAAAKLTPIAFVAALPLMGFTSAAVWMLVTVGALVLLVPWPFLGTSEHWRHLEDFYRTMIAPLFGGGDGNTTIWGGANASIAGTLRTLLQAPLEPGPMQVHWAELSDATLRTVQRVYSGVLLLVCAWAFFAVRSRPARVAAQFAVVTISMALFSPLTRTYHCASLLLAGLLFVVDPKQVPARRAAWGIVAALFAFSMILRQKGLLGRDLWWALDHLGLMHFGIVGMLVLLATRPRDDGA